MCVFPCPCSVKSLKILYSDTASPDDPTELSFAKGEILDVLDKQGKWWQAKNSDGTPGSKFLLGYGRRHSHHADFSRPIKLSPDHLKIAETAYVPSIIGFVAYSQQFNISMRTTPTVVLIVVMIPFPFSHVLVPS